jgi:hypothetical protein
MKVVVRTKSRHTILLNLNVKTVSGMTPLREAKILLLEDCSNGTVTKSCFDQSVCFASTLLLARKKCHPTTGMVANVRRTIFWNILS